MKRKILFVDDEVNILKGLQRSLRPMRTYWDMVFAEGPHHALDFLKSESFDVIVSDMRMPEMDGSQLLKIVKEDHPTMVRIILSGYSDQEMTMKSLKSAHQYLSKPCEKKTLVTAIARACSLRDLLNEKSLQDLLGGMETLPSVPALYTRIMKELQSSDASAGSVGEIIAQDMGMTAKVLQLVNSSFFGMPRHISTAKDAVVLLGIDVVKALVLSAEVFSAFSKKTLSVISVDQIHDHCVRTSVIAKEIAMLEKMDKETADNAMIASILHDLGKLVMAEHFLDRYKEVMALAEQNQMPVFEAERQIFSVTHAEVGAYLLGLWGLPDTIIEGIAFHHNPAKYISNEFELCGLVHVAELMEHHEQCQGGQSDELGGMDTDYIEKIGKTENLSLWREGLQKKNQAI